MLYNPGLEVQETWNASVCAGYRSATGTLLVYFLSTGIHFWSTLPHEVFNIARTAGSTPTLNYETTQTTALSHEPETFLAGII